MHLLQSAGRIIRRRSGTAFGLLVISPMMAPAGAFPFSFVRTMSPTCQTEVGKLNAAVCGYGYSQFCSRLPAHNLQFTA
jgi:hypothetical protein